MSANYQPLELPPGISVPLFFDEKRFSRDLASGDPVTVFRNALSAAQSHFNNRFHEGEEVHTLVNESAQFADIMLCYAWNRFEWDDNISLIAVGGYGRGELHPHSDIDLLILMRRNRPQKYRQSIEQFLTFLWDIQLKIGHSVRSLSQCVDEARADITVATNLMETRLLRGDSALREAMLKKTGPKKIWSSSDFYRGKIDEQRARHRKHDDTEYNLEPNVKEAPGGLRDIQLINWTAKRHFDVHRRSQLVHKGFLSDEEYLTLRREEEFLWKVRYGLHLIAGRPEERLLFDYQRKLAVMFDYKDSDGRLGVEKFMQRYYRAVLSIREITDVLLQYLDEAIYRKDKTKVVTAVNQRFVIRDDYLDTTSETVFRDQPSALLELFAIMGENKNIKDIRASAIRQIRLHRNLINDEFRASTVNRELFMRILRAPYKLSIQLQRMNRYGILGGYLPEFGKIVGQTQHDLFHIYPVDVHTLQVVRNIRLLARPEVAEQFPVSAHIFKNQPKPELLIIAALYHDIAKGRGGDHSILGSADIADFGERHGLRSKEIKLLQWLVENHLLMSTISQREDTSDPDVIYKFAKHCGDQMHLDMLYVLTVADINATNPRLWTDWKGSLMRNLYFETKRALQQGLGVPVDRVSWVNYAKTAALRLLLEEQVAEDQALGVWSDVDQEFFLRERVEDISSFTKAIIANPDPQSPVIVMSDVGIEIPVATQIFVHTTGRQNIFSIIAAVLDKMQLNIQDARLHTTSDGRAFDVFYVLDEKDRPIGANQRLCKQVTNSLRLGIVNPGSVSTEISRRTPRQLKNFTLKTVASLRNDIETDTTVLEVITPDRPGLLAHLASIFLRYNLNLYNAKITTLGERVEDTFYLTDQHNKPLTDMTFSKELQETICRELDSRNRDDQQSSGRENNQIWL
ncbi:MAG: [protein-PII] uridylyltransferase [Porticoccaceae bacterium]|nr:[protein-PII] uridylyltransferase [Porticoccaceae bacterium]MBT5577662.1 [protein-PII] uridylyltransferase [Porticoccaceae bacterium]